MDLLETDITITVGTDQYVFALPSPRELAKVGKRAQSLRLADDPNDSSEWGLDSFTGNLYRSMALFECLLKKASVTWPWSQTEDNRGLVIDSGKFPPESTPILLEVHGKFNQALNKFHDRGNRDGDGSGSEGVAGQPDTVVQPV